MSSTIRFQHLVDALINFVPHAAEDVSAEEKVAVASITF